MKSCSPRSVYEVILSQLHIRKRESEWNCCWPTAAFSYFALAAECKNFKREIVLDKCIQTATTEMDSSTNGNSANQLSSPTFIAQISTSVERVFSESGLLMCPHSSRLTKEMLFRITFVKCNLHLLRWNISETSSLIKNRTCSQMWYWPKTDSPIVENRPLFR